MFEEGTERGTRPRTASLADLLRTSKMHLLQETMQASLSWGARRASMVMSSSCADSRLSRTSGRSRLMVASRCSGVTQCSWRIRDCTDRSFTSSCSSAAPARASITLAPRPLPPSLRCDTSVPAPRRASAASNGRRQSPVHCGVPNVSPTPVGAARFAGRAGCSNE